MSRLSTTHNRLTRLRELLQPAALDALLVMRPENRVYLSGFTGSDGALLVTSDKAFVITDFRYTEQAQLETEGWLVIQHNGPLVEIIAALAAEEKIEQLGFEPDYVTYQQYTEYTERMRGVQLRASAGLVERLRLVKEPMEIDLIRAAANLADRAFTRILSLVKPGVRELDLAVELEYLMRREGAAGMAFETIVASGPRSSLPHGTATNRQLNAGDFVTFDFGAVYRGYCSDCTRTVVVGEPSRKQREIYAIVREAQAAGVRAIRPGVRANEVDRVARAIIEDHGYGQYFGHSLGHGVGKVVHEEPRLAAKDETVLASGMVLTVEPGIYLPGWGGVRIEDLVVVREQGAEVITQLTKELIMV